MSVGDWSLEKPPAAGPVFIDGEVLPPLKPQTAIYQPSPFSLANPVKIEILPGTTLAEIVAKTGVPEALWGHLHIEIDGHLIYREAWRVTRPKHNAIVTIRAVPGGKGGKNVLRMVLVVALVVAVAYFAPQLAPALLQSMGVSSFVVGGALVSATAAGIGATLTFAGMLLINALIPPQYGAGANGDDQRFALTGTNNQFAPYSNVPRVFGKWRMFPLLGARPYTETFGDDQFLRMLLLVGFGPLRITDIKIGETPISAFTGVEVQVHEGGPSGWAGNNTLSLFNRQVREEAVSVPLNPGIETTRTTFPDTVEINVTIVFPQGLVKFNKKNAKEDATVDVAVQYRAFGTTGAWLNAEWEENYDGATGVDGRLRGTGRALAVVRKTGRWRVPKGRYDVRLSRTTAASGDSSVVDAVAWETLRSLRDDTPVVQEGVTLIAIRMRASEQLNGVPNTINCIAESYLPVRNAGTGIWSYQITGNNAWVYADLLRRRGPETMIADSRIDLPAIQAWATDCDATAPNAAEPRWSFNGVMQGGSVFDAARTVASGARASFALKDGKYSVIRDVPQTVPVQHITPRNSWGYEGSKRFVDIPHALRVRFTNADKGYQPDEVIVFNDGFDAGSATRYETMDVKGPTTSTAAWREGRYFLAVGQLRPEEHRVSQDIEQLRCTMGDLVRFSHDVILVGLAAGRITATIDFDASNYLRFDLDQEIVIETGKTYSVRVRRRDGVTKVYAVDAAAMGVGAHQGVVFNPRAPKSDNIQPGDLFMFGESGLETIPCLVRKIETSKDLSATLTLVEANPAIWTADTGTIPAFTSKITTQGPPEQARPSVPVFTLRSGATVADNLGAGAVTSRLAVDITPAVSSDYPVQFHEVQWRESGGAGKWLSAGQVVPGQGSFFVEPVRMGAAYDVRVRAISPYGMASDWGTLLNYLVLGKTLPPGAPTSLTATGGYRSITLSWVNPTDEDLAYIVVYRSATNDFATATALVRVAGTRFTDSPLSPGATFFYWVLAVDFSNNAGSRNDVGGRTATVFGIADLEGIGRDNVLSGDEKLAVAREFAQIVNERSTLAAQGTALGLSVTAYNAAYNALNSYLTGLSPAWDDETVQTPITRSTWDSTWGAYYTARTALDVAVKAKVGTTSNWSGVVDDGGRPAYNATNSGDLVEHFGGYADTAALQTAWELSAGCTLHGPDGNMTGGRGLRMTGTNANAVGRLHVPYSYEDLYEISARLYVEAVGTTNTVYLGFVAYDATGAALVDTTYGSHHYVAGALSIPTPGFYDFTGYVRGRAPRYSGKDGRPSPNPSDPATALNGTTSIRPLIYANFGGSGGITIADQFSIKKVEDLVPLPTRPWLAGDLQQKGQVVTYLGRSWIARVENTGVTPPATSTGTATWGLVVDKGADGANAKTLVIASDRQTISFNSAGAASPSVQTITFTANKQNTTAAVTWAVFDATNTPIGGAPTYISASSGDSVTMTVAQFEAGRNGTKGVIVKATLVDGADTLVDQISVVRVNDGTNGTNGDPGPPGDPGDPGAPGAPGDAWRQVFIRAASTPATPAASAGTPSGWYATTDAVPGGSEPMWSSGGARASGASNYTWQAPIRVEAIAGVLTGQSVPLGFVTSEEMTFTLSPGQSRIVGAQIRLDAPTGSGSVACNIEWRPSDGGWTGSTGTYESYTTSEFPTAEHTVTVTNSGLDKVTYVVRGTGLRTNGSSGPVTVSRSQLVI